MRTSDPARRSRLGPAELYWEMLEALGGSQEDGPPLEAHDRFAAAMGVRRDARTGAPKPIAEHEREALVRRALAEHLARRPEMATHVRRRSCARLQVRFPRALYDELAAAAAADGTSINTFVVAACAGAVAKRRVLGNGTEQHTERPGPIDDQMIERLMRA